MDRIIRRRKSRKREHYYYTFVNLYKKGYSVRQIAKTISVSHVTLYKWLHEAIEKGQIETSAISELPGMGPQPQDHPKASDTFEIPKPTVALPKAPPPLSGPVGIPAIVEEVVREMAQKTEPPSADDYKTKSKDELIAIIERMKKNESDYQMKLKAYQTLIEIAGRNCEEDLVKKAGAKQPGP